MTAGYVHFPSHTNTAMLLPRAPSNALSSTHTHINTHSHSNTHSFLNTRSHSNALTFSLRASSSLSEIFQGQSFFSCCRETSGCCASLNLKGATVSSKRLRLQTEKHTTEERVWNPFCPAPVASFGTLPSRSPCERCQPNIPSLPP